MMFSKVFSVNYQTLARLKKEHLKLDLHICETLRVLIGSSFVEVGTLDGTRLLVHETYHDDDQFLSLYNDAETVGDQLIVRGTTSSVDKMKYLQSWEEFKRMKDEAKEA